MSSKPATVLVMLTVAIVAFCLASCFAAMTGPISILPMELDSGNTSDDVSDVQVDNSDDNNDYQDYSDYSGSSYSGYDVETTTDNGEPSSDTDAPSDSHADRDSGSDNPSVETTTD